MMVEVHLCEDCRFMHLYNMKGEVVCQCWKLGGMVTKPDGFCHWWKPKPELDFLNKRFNV